MAPNRDRRTGFDALIDEIAARLDAPDLAWAFTGSVAHRLHGMPTTVRDIDILTDRTGAYAVPPLLGAAVVQPVAFNESERVRSHFGILSWRDWVVEIMGDIEFRAAEGTWEPPIDMRSHRTAVQLGARTIPVMSLAYEMHMYERLGRLEKVAKLRAFSAGRET